MLENDQESVMFTCIRWIDPHSEDEWQPADDLRHSFDLVNIVTVGRLIHETDERLVVALNYDPNADSVSCSMIIPKSAIVDRQDFCLPRGWVLEPVKQKNSG